jgi:hypothetical protein
MSIDGVLIPIIAVASVPIIAIGLPIARAWARRMDRESAQPMLPPDVSHRLERIEQAVDAIAVEVERISEGQRFTTRLLSEGGASPRRADAPPPHVDTPY